MNRTFFRFVSVAAMLLAITFVTLPTAEARGLSGSQRAVTHTNDLWSTALSWLANLLPGGNAGQGAGLSHRSSASTLGGTGTGDLQLRPNTGSCIDPMGGHCTL
jgi:hypothetical protein